VQLLESAGTSFPLVARRLASKSLWEAVQQHLSNPNKADKQLHPIPLACGSPGIGKSRLAMEVVNMLTAEADGDFRDLFAECVHIGITFNMRSPVSPFDIHPPGDLSNPKMLDSAQHMLAVRILFSAFGQSMHFKTFQTLFRQRSLCVADSLLCVRSGMATSGSDGLIVIAVDEFNKLGEGSDLLRPMISALGAVQMNPPPGVRVVVLLAGTDWRDAQQIITKSIGVPQSLPLVLFGEDDVVTILNSIQERLLVSIGMHWRCSWQFRALVQDVNGHPRLLEKLVELVLKVPRDADVDWPLVESSVVSFAFEAYSFSLTRQVCNAILRQWFLADAIDVDAALHEGSEATWISLFERGLVYFDNDRVRLPWLWLRKISSVAGVSMTSAAQRQATDPLQWWQQFELFVVDFMVLRARILRNPTMRSLLQGALVSSTSEATVLSATVRIDASPRVSFVQFPRTTPTVACDGTVCFKNGNGAPSDAVWPECAPGVVLYIQMKNWEGLTQGPSNAVTLGTIVEEVGKAIDAHNDAGLSLTAFHLFVTSRPLHEDVTPADLPLNTAVVGPRQFDEIFGPLARRAHFAAQTRRNVNCAPASVLQMIDGLGPTGAQKIVAERANGPFANANDLHKRIPGLQRKNDSLLEF